MFLLLPVSSTALPALTLPLSSSSCSCPYLCQPQPCLPSLQARALDSLLNCLLAHLPAPALHPPLLTPTATRRMSHPPRPSPPMPLGLGQAAHPQQQVQQPARAWCTRTPAYTRGVPARQGCVWCTRTPALCVWCTRTPAYTRAHVPCRGVCVPACLCMGTPKFVYVLAGE